jgi:ACS family tartrate transporter-like MFS transporter
MSYLTDRPAAAHWLSEEHRAWLMDELRREQTALAGVVRTEIRSIFSDARIWLLAIVYLGLALASYGISFWLPTVIRGLAVKRTFMIGLLFTIPYMCGVVTMVLTGLHSDRTGERRWHVSIAALASSVGLFSAAYSTSIVSTMMAFSLAVLGINAMLGPFWALPTTMLGGAAAAAGIAMINTIGNLGGFLGPYVIGILKTRSGGFRSSLLLLSAGMLTSSVGTLLVRLRPESPGGDS